MLILAQIKSDNGPGYIARKIKWLFSSYNIKHVTGILHNPTGQKVTERSNRTIKDRLKKQKWVENVPSNRLHNPLLTLNFLKADEKETIAAERFIIISLFE